jgi:hypothetical protein
MPRQVAAADDPIAFAQSLYALPHLWADVTSNAASMDRYLAKGLGALVAASQATSDPGAALDYDPLVQGPAFEGVEATFAIEEQTDTTAVVHARISNFGDDKVVFLDLLQTPAGWRLANVRIDEESPSLVDQLNDRNADTQ